MAKMYDFKIWMNNKIDISSPSSNKLSNIDFYSRTFAHNLALFKH